MSNPNLGKHGLGYRPPKRNGLNSELDGAFFNDADPRYLLGTEKPIHRQMAELATAGYTIREIAAATGYGVTAVSNSLRQPFVRTHMIETIKKSAQDELREVLEAEGKPAILRVIKLSKEAASEPVKLAANNAILDRLLGRPNQPITTTALDPSKLADTELEAQARQILESRTATSDSNGTTEPEPSA